jgi:hypothetical protein
MQLAIQCSLAHDFGPVINSCGEVQNPTGSLDQVVEIDHFMAGCPQKSGAVSGSIILRRAYNLET